MLRFLRRIFGGDSDPEPSHVERRRKPRTSAASVLSEKPAPPDTPAATVKPETSGLSLEDPGPSTHTPGSGSDPYDTGTFNQPNAWGKASKRRNN
jgi:hypothetical protein